MDFAIPLQLRHSTYEAHVHGCFCNNSIKIHAKDTQFTFKIHNLKNEIHIAHCWCNCKWLIFGISGWNGIGETYYEFSNP